MKPVIDRPATNSNEARTNNNTAYNSHLYAGAELQVIGFSGQMAAPVGEQVIEVCVERFKQAEKVAG